MYLMTWHLWLVGSIILFILEILTPGGFILACLGAASLITSFVALLGVGIIGQVTTFAVSSLALFFGVRPIFLKLFLAGDQSRKTNVEALVGRVGIVTQPIDPDSDTGRVKVNGEDWRGISADGIYIPAGTKVLVVGWEGVKLILRKLGQ